MTRATIITESKAGKRGQKSNREPQELECKISDKCKKKSSNKSLYLLFGYPSIIQNKKSNAQSMLE